MTTILEPTERSKSTAVAPSRPTRSQRWALPFAAVLMGLALWGLLLYLKTWERNRTGGLLSRGTTKTESVGGWAYANVLGLRDFQVAGNAPSPLLPTLKSAGLVINEGGQRGVESSPDQLSPRDAKEEGAVKPDLSRDSGGQKRGEPARTFKGVANALEFKIKDAASSAKQQARPLGRLGDLESLDRKQMESLAVTAPAPSRSLAAAAPMTPYPLDGQLRAQPPMAGLSGNGAVDRPRFATLPSGPGERVELRMAEGGRAAQTMEYRVKESEIVLKKVRPDQDGSQMASTMIPIPPPSQPQPAPETPTIANAVSTFSLNVADVSFRLAAESLERGSLPEPSTVRVEEFVNAFQYRDPIPSSGSGVSFAWERSLHPYAQGREILRLSLRTAASGREGDQPLNLVLLLDHSGSMERADRVQILREAVRTLGSQLKASDRVSVVTFARTARLWVDGIAGDQVSQLAAQLDSLKPEGGTHLEEALRVGYETALRHFQAGGGNRLVLLTDGAANLGDVNADHLRETVITWRRKGVALDCFGIGWEGLNDPLLESLSRNGDGRYGFVNSPEEATGSFATQLAGALHVSASDVKVQVEFNPDRVQLWRQVGYALHQLKAEDFRNRAIDAAELGASESGTALYVIQTIASGSGPIGTVRVRYHRPGSADDQEQDWTVPYTGIALPLATSSPSQRLAVTSAAFGEWLGRSPFAMDITPGRLLQQLQGLPGEFAPAPEPARLEAMIRQAMTLSPN